ncbi:MAG TPA: helix-turn-helix transcriptional regulator [Ferruginibacter sp.]|nr:helix-turn-helix transcriptional regulator [Ferruginibacter sp.]
MCAVKNNIAYRIRKLRESKDYSQENMAGELGITTSAYSKIERGITDPSIGRMAQIAKILEVEVTYFFQEQNATAARIEDPNKTYGFATKSDIEELTNIINKIKQEIADLKASFKAQPDRKKKKQ